MYTYRVYTRNIVMFRFIAFICIVLCALASRDFQERVFINICTKCDAAGCVRFGVVKSFEDQNRIFIALANHHYIYSAKIWCMQCALGSFPWIRNKNSHNQRHIMVHAQYKTIHVCIALYSDTNANKRICTRDLSERDRRRCIYASLHDYRIQNHVVLTSTHFFTYFGFLLRCEYGSKVGHHRVHVFVQRR